MSNNNKKKKLDPNMPTTMSAAPKQLPYPDTAISAGNDVVNFPRDMNNIFKGIGNAWNTSVMGDWYDPDHQTVAYKMLHPQAQQIANNAVQQAIQSNPAATPAKTINQAAENALPGTLTKKPIQQTKPAPSQSFKPVAQDPKTGTTVFQDQQTGAGVVHNASTGATQPIPPEQMPPSQPVQGQVQATQPQVTPIIENPVEAEKKNIEARQAQIDANMPHILNALGLADTPENRFQVQNNMIKPEAPWAVQHPFAALAQQALQGVSQGAMMSGYGRGNPNNMLAANMINGLGAGVRNGSNTVESARDQYTKDMNTFRGNAASGLERGRVYSDVPGTALNTSLTTGDLETRARTRKGNIEDYNKAIQPQVDQQKYAHDIDIYSQLSTKLQNDPNYQPTPEEMQAIQSLQSSAFQSAVGNMISPQGRTQLQSDKQKVATGTPATAGSYIQFQNVINKIDQAKGNYTPSAEELKGLTQDQLKEAFGHLSKEYQIKIQGLNTTATNAQHLEEFKTHPEKDPNVQALANKSGSWSSAEVARYIAALQRGASAQELDTIFAEGMGIPKRATPKTIGGIGAGGLSGLPNLKK